MITYPELAGARSGGTCFLFWWRELWLFINNFIAINTEVSKMWRKLFCINKIWSVLDRFLFKLILNLSWLCIYTQKKMCNLALVPLINRRTQSKVSKTQQQEVDWVTSQESLPSWKQINGRKQSRISNKSSLQQVRGSQWQENGENVLWDIENGHIREQAEEK